MSTHPQAAIARALVTTLGTSSVDWVPVALDDDGANFPGLYGASAGVLLKCGRLDRSAFCGALTTAGYSRAAQNKGVHAYKGRSGTVIKIAAHHPGFVAPYEGLRLLDLSKPGDLSRFDTAMKELEEQLDADGGAQRSSLAAAFRSRGSLRKHFEGVLNEISFTPVEAKAKGPPPRVKHGGKSTSHPRILNLTPEESPHVTALLKASNLVLEDPLATEHFVDLAKFLKQSWPRGDVPRHAEPTFEGGAAADPRGGDPGCAGDTEAPRGGEAAARSGRGRRPR